MPTPDKSTHYTVAKILHWVTAYLIFANLVSGWRLGGLPASSRNTFVMLHASVGTTICVLMVFRWWWRTSHALYASAGWWRKPRKLLQVSFYPLLLLQVILGIVQAAFVSFEVRAFGFISYSSLAPDNETLHRLFLTMHGLTGVLLIVLIALHALEPESATEHPSQAGS